MVVRAKKRSRKYLGNRSWGAGNIKNRRGGGDRGGVGRGGVKHKFSHKVVYEKDTIGSHGFTPFRKRRLTEINLDSILQSVKGDSKEISLPGYKVLGGGSITSPLSIKAASFSKKAIEKIKAAGGEAIKL